MRSASGGAHTSRTILLADLAAVLSACPGDANQEQFRVAVIDVNAAGKGSLSSRQRTFRYLREMYLLDISDPTFRAMVRLWSRDPKGRPLMALLMASAHDRALAATASEVLRCQIGEVVTSAVLASAVEREFPGNYAEQIRAKIGRNALSSWTQAGYLTRDGRGPATRQAIEPTPGAVAMALVLGHQDGLSGERLFDSGHAALLDASVATLHDRAHDAARKGLLEYRSRGRVTEIDLTGLLAEVGATQLPIVMERSQ